MILITVIASVILVLGLIAWVAFVRSSLARDAEQHAKGKKSANHLSTYGDPPM